MEIKPNKGTFQVKPLPNQGRWSGKICDRFFETTKEKTPTVFLGNDSFHKKLLEQDILFALNGGSAKAKRIPETVKGLRYCFDKYGLLTFRTVFAVLARNFEGENGMRWGAQEDALIDSDRDEMHYIFQVSYQSEELNGSAAISDTYIQNTGEWVPIGNNPFENMCEVHKNRVVAKDPINQPKIDVLEAMIRKIAKDVGLVVVIVSNGELNYPTIQAVGEVSTPYGPCVRKVTVSFSQEYAELVTAVPVDNLTTLKGV